MVELQVKSVSYMRDARSVLQDVSVTLGEGVTVIAGPNGAGKTTLLNLMAGLAVPDMGDVLLDGKAVHTLSPLRRAQQVAYLPQFPQCCWPLTVRRVVELGRHPLEAGWKWHEAGDVEAAIDALLESMELADYSDRSVNSLSGGERQRVMLARALASEPKILLLDEPATGLDPAHQLFLMKRLMALAGGGLQVVAIMHDLLLAQRFADRLLVLDKGALVADGAADEVITPTLLASVFGVDEADCRVFLPA